VPDCDFRRLAEHHIHCDMKCSYYGKGDVFHIQLTEFTCHDPLFNKLFDRIKELGVVGLEINIRCSLRRAVIYRVQ